MSRSRTWMLTTVALAVAALPAAADEGADSNAGTDTPTWRGGVMPYLWVPASLSGTIALGSDSVSMQANTVDLLKNLQMAAAIRGGVWYGKVGLLLDVMYARFGDERSAARGDYDVTIDGALSEAAIAYQLGTWSTSPDDAAMKVSAVLYGGVRVSWFKLALEHGPMSSERSTTLVDPVIGMRVPIRLSPTWQFALRGDVGGFGVSSDVMWNVELGFERDFSSSIGLVFGYRIMDVVFSSEPTGSKPEATLQMLGHGPALAVSFDF